MNHSNNSGSKVMRPLYVLQSPEQRFAAERARRIRIRGRAARGVLGDATERSSSEDEEPTQSERIVIKTNIVIDGCSMFEDNNVVRGCVAESVISWQNHEDDVEFIDKLDASRFNNSNDDAFISGSNFNINSIEYCSSDEKSNTNNTNNDNNCNNDNNNADNNNSDECDSMNTSSNNDEYDTMGNNDSNNYNNHSNVHNNNDNLSFNYSNFDIVRPANKRTAPRISEDMYAKLNKKIPVKFIAGMLLLFLCISCFYFFLVPPQ